MRKFRIGWVMICIIALLFAQVALAEEAPAVEAVEETVDAAGDMEEAVEDAFVEEVPFVCWLHAKVGEAVLNVQPTQYGDSLFLPTYAELTAVQLSACGDGEGQPLTLTAEEAQLLVASGEPVDLTTLFPDGPDEEGVYNLGLVLYYKTEGGELAYSYHELGESITVKGKKVVEDEVFTVPAIEEAAEEAADEDDFVIPFAEPDAGLFESDGPVSVG